MAFKFSPYQSGVTPTIANMLQRQGDIEAQRVQQIGEAQARGAMQSGSAWGNAVQGIGQAVAGIPGQIEGQKRTALQDEALGLQVGQGRQEVADRTALDTAFKGGKTKEEILAGLPGHLQGAVSKQFQEADERALRTQKLRSELEEADNEYFAGLGHTVKEYGYDLGAAGIALMHARNTYQNDPERLKRIDSIAAQIQQDPNNVKLVVDGLMARSPKFIELGQKQTTLDQTAAHQQNVETTTQAQRDETRRHNMLMESIGKLGAGRQEAAQRETERHNKAMELHAANASQPLEPIMGPDGKSVLVNRRDALGKQPASNRENRPVTSGDANKIADFDTSLNDIKTLRGTLTETSGATGTTAAIGAGMPDFATDWWGIGMDAKKRQGVIDRVKQVIGKALEGGVLRKEDEYKYTKILPTIKDAPEVAASKMDGLEQALIQRRSTTLDALNDAGYDTAKFDKRTPSAPTGADPYNTKNTTTPAVPSNPFRKK